MRTHERRTIECPLCHSDKRYRTIGDAMSHVESGFCNNCRGQSNARQQIYNFTRQQAPHLTNHLAIENGYSDEEEISYHCDMCNKNF